MTRGHLLYVVKQPLGLRDLDRYGIRKAMERGMTVTVLDVSDWLHPELPNIPLLDQPIPGLRHLIADRRSAKGVCDAEISAADLVVLAVVSFGVSRGALPILRMLRKRRRPYLIMAPQVYPGYGLDTARQGWLARLGDIRTRLSKMDPVNSIIARLPLGVLGVRPADFAVLGCGRSLSALGRLVGPRTQRIEAHGWDYDRYLEVRNTGVETTETAVFLDQYMPYHVDYTVLGAPPLDPDGYFSGLNALFDRIEKELGLEVIISAHPRADYSDKPNAFGGRRILAGQSAELIAASRLVLAHNSTAIGFAVAFGKPLMLLTTKVLYERQVYEKHLYAGLAATLGTPLWFYDRPGEVELRTALSVDAPAYDRYLRTYLTCSTEACAPLWDKVFREIFRETPKTDK